MLWVFMVGFGVLIGLRGGMGKRSVSRNLIVWIYMYIYIGICE